MTDPRERLLAELIYDKLIGIQKSKEIYEKLSKLERNILKMSEKQLEKYSKTIASKVHRWYMQEKDSGNTPSPRAVKQKVREELEEL